jgi:hypothetical protein
MGGNAPHNEARHTPAPVGADDDQVNSESLRRFNNCIIRKSTEQHPMRFDPYFVGFVNERTDVLICLCPRG